MSDQDDVTGSDILGLTHDLSDEKLASRKRNQDDRDKAEEDNLWRAVLGERIGRRALYRLLVAAGSFRDNFAVTPSGIPDQYMTWYLQGQKELGQRLYHSWMLVDFDLVKSMLDENDPRFTKAKRKRGDP